MVTVFIDDDDGYLRWVQDNPDGYVLNTSLASPKRSSHTIHKADCSSVTGEPYRGKLWTHEYLKACGSRTAVERFGEAVIKVAPRLHAQCT